MLEYPEVNLKGRSDIRFAKDDFLDEIAEVINNAKSPVLLVGGGAINSGAQAELVELAEKAVLSLLPLRSWDWAHSPATTSVVLV